MSNMHVFILSKDMQLIAAYRGRSCKTQELINCIIQNPTVFCILFEPKMLACIPFLSYRHRKHDICWSGYLCSKIDYIEGLWEYSNGRLEKRFLFNQL